MQSQMQRNVHATEEADRDAARLLNIIDKVPFIEVIHTLLYPLTSGKAIAKWEQIPLDDIQSWTLQTAESAGSKA